MMTERVVRDFFARDEDEQKLFTEQTWCDACGQADLGMHTPIEYALGDSIFIEGQCNQCNSPVVTELSEDSDDWDESDDEFDDEFDEEE